MEKKGNYCFAISLFQLIFHCLDIILCLQNQNIQNDTEILLSYLIKKICTKRQNSSIVISKFIKNRNKWSSTSGYLSNLQEYQHEFVQYLLYSCSHQFDSMFKFEL